MTSEEATVGGWRVVASWPESAVDTHRVSVELDRNMGAMWPRVIVDVEAQTSDATRISIAPTGVTDQTRDGAHQFAYKVGIDEHCASALLHGAVEGLDSHQGIDVHIASGGVADDTAEHVCRIAARVATSLLIARLGRPQSLGAVLEQCL